MMKKIGLIGGIGWSSTIEYYRYLNQFVGLKLGNDNAASLILINLDSGEIRQLAERNEEKKIYDMLAQSIQTLQAADAELIVLCANGVHRFHEKLQANCIVPIIHIVEATALAVKKSQLKQVGLLGIKKTMEGNFYQAIFEKHGIKIIVPNSAERDFLDTTIYEELMHERLLDSTKQKYIQIIDRLKNEGAEGIILGCTEIPLLIKQKDSPILLFPTTEIHCKAAIEIAFSFNDDPAKNLE